MVEQRDNRWRHVARAAGLLDASGDPQPTIFAEMTELATRTGAANLGQGFPDADGPAWILDAAVDAIRAGHNQYPPGRGIPALRAAIAEHQARHYGLQLDPDRNVLVTAGATEAIAAALLALTGPGDEVVTLEPFYDAHAACIGMAGATHVTVPLVPVSSEAERRIRFALDNDALDRAVGPATRAIIVNTPHNPTGTVLTRAELEAIAAAAVRVGAIVITDEVYEHLRFGLGDAPAAAHVPIATLPGMAERTLTISSAGKTFSVTGWKVGWVTGPADLIDALAAVKQFLTYSGGAPFQPAIARALAEGDDDVAALRASLAARKDLLIDGLTRAGFPVVHPEGTYFVCADATPFLDGAGGGHGGDPDGGPDGGPDDGSDGVPDGAAFARQLPELAGVACVPVSAFCHPGSPTAAALANWVRFTFVKDEDVLRTAIDRLAAFAVARR